MSYQRIEELASIAICVYCTRTRNRKLSMTFDRKVPKIGYTDDNVTVSCIDCNRLKSDKFTYNEMRIIGQAYGQVYKLRNEVA